MERFLASTFLFLSATSAVFAQGYDYNGDYMVLKAQGTDITIEYAFDQTNRPGPGTLFKGKILNNQEPLAKLRRPASRGRCRARPRGLAVVFRSMTTPDWRFWTRRSLTWVCIGRHG
jgi:hypothetical protein